MRRPSAPPRNAVRFVLAIGVLGVLATLILDMSGAALRLSGSDGIKPQVFATVAPGGSTVCQAVGPLPPDTGAAKILVGTYGRPLPPLRMRFLDTSGSTVAAGGVRGGRQGYVVIPLTRSGRLSSVTRVCLSIGERFRLAIAGTPAPTQPVDEVIDGRPAPGVFSIFYLRARPETWWQLLPVLDHRFGLGKAPFFGRWTLPVLALLMLAVWAGAIRFLARELR